jgi:hypothetical protein
MKLAMAGLVLTLITQVAYSQTPPQMRKQAKKPVSAESGPVFPINGEHIFEGRVVRGSIRKSEIDSLLARRVELSGAPSDADYGKYGLGFIYEEGKLPAFSCQEWAQARVLGLNSNLNTYERTMESFFMGACSFLYALKDARPAKRSFIASPKAGLSNLDLLPDNVLESLSGEGADEIDNLTARRVRISQLVGRREIKVTHKTDTSLALDYDFNPETSIYYSRIVLDERARADFDGDGIEDIFVSTAWYATQGTARLYDYFFLTRRSPSAGFEVKRIELPALKENPEASLPRFEFKSSELERARITKKEYGDGWPFEAEQGELACAKAGSVAVFFIARETTYPLNAWGRGSKIDGVSVASDTRDVAGNSLGAILNRAFAMCRTKEGSR